jgi:hypothetical protein
MSIFHLGLNAGMMLAVAAPTAITTRRDLRRVRSDDPVDYISAVIESLGRLRSSFEEAKPDEGLTSTIRNIRAAQNDMRCGANALKPFRLSKNAGIATSAKLFGKMFETFLSIHDQSVAFTIELANNPGKYGDRTIVQKRGVLAAKRDEAWQLVIGAIRFSTGSLLRFTENKVSGLNITAADRKKLLDDLEKTLGPLANGEVPLERKPLQAAAGVLHRFLSNPKWKACDE